MNRALVLLLLLLGLTGWHRTTAQTASVTGVVLDENGNPLGGVGIASRFATASTDENGFYLIRIRADSENTLLFSRQGYREFRLDGLILQTHETRLLNPILERLPIAIEGVEISARAEPGDAHSLSLSLDSLSRIPGAYPGVENILKLLPGVASDNELSTQYRVRGGNFEENLVYVNGIEVYRPFLLRSAQQEGLSFLNSQLISGLKFSPGGFQARYGDRLSSVLDVEYKRPTGFGYILEASLLGLSVSVESGSRDLRFTHISGVRYRDNRLFVSSLPGQSFVEPRFFDAQTYSEYRINGDWTLGFLATRSMNRYINRPVSQVSNFGTLQEPRTVFIDFQGREDSRYETSLGALQLRYNPHSKLSLRGGITAYHTYEEEFSDILASYRIGSLSGDISGESSPEDQPLGLGQSLNRSRNQLDALILGLFHQGLWDTGTGILRWGLRFQVEDFKDVFNESEFLFESGTVFREDPGSEEPAVPFEGPIRPLYSVDARNHIRNERIAGFAQWGRQWKGRLGTTYLNAGLRSQTWRIRTDSLNGKRQWLLSPRIQLSYKPPHGKDIIWRAAVGNYQQPPFFRELRDGNGQIRPEVMAQNSWHFTLGNDWSFKMNDRPFTLSSDVYYKNMTRVNAYTLSDVRIRYRADNDAVAYATGIDLRLSGAFVPGTQSWLSLGLMSSKENIGGRGYIPRPTDQRLKLGLLFQDYVPRFPNMRLYLNMVYQTGVPGGAPPNSDPYEYQGRLRDYRRADMGISYIFALPEDKVNQPPVPVSSIQLGIELYNMFNNRNSITNSWVRDAESQGQFALPNFLTPRLLNIIMKIRL